MQLAERDIEVHLAEKAAFPRDKVCGCCLGGSGIETLDKLGLADWTTGKWRRDQSMECLYRRPSR